MERETGFEPATSTLARSHSTTELFPPGEPLNYHDRLRLGYGESRRSASGGRNVRSGCGRSTGAARYTRTRRSTSAASSGAVGLM